MIWDVPVIIHVDYFKKGKSTISEYNVNWLKRFSGDVKEEGPHLTKNGILFYQDNACVNDCVVSMDKFHKFGFEIPPQLPYSPDLSLSGYFLDPNMKKGSNDEVIALTNA